MELDLAKFKQLEEPKLRAIFNSAVKKSEKFRELALGVISKTPTIVDITNDCLNPQNLLTYILSSYNKLN